MDQNLMDALITALVSHYGADALQMAEKQAALSAVEARKTWLSVVERLRHASQSSDAGQTELPRQQIDRIPN